MADKLKKAGRPKKQSSDDSVIPIPPPLEVKSIPTLVNYKTIHDLPDIEPELKTYISSVEKVDSQRDGKIDSPIGKIQIIAPETILSLLKTDNQFVLNIASNLKKLYLKKWAKYYDIYNKTLDPYNTDEFSMRPQLLQMIELAKKKYEQDVDLGQLASNINDAINDSKNGVLTLSGDSRRNMRNFLANQIYLISRSIVPFIDSFLNISITGPPGSGKTKMASILAFVYAKMGILLKDYPNNILIGSAKDVVSPFEGGTATKANSFLGRGLESVVFIDEAYSIMSCSNDKLSSQQGYGPEAIAEIVNFLDVYRGLSVVVVAGYEKSLKNCFFGANQGLERRFPSSYMLESYSPDDLTVQFINLTNERQGQTMFSQITASAIKYIITQLYVKNKFPNQGGDIANMVAIFSKVIDSYYNKNWTLNPTPGIQLNTNLFMLGQMELQYLQNIQ